MSGIFFVLNFSLFNQMPHVSVFTKPLVAKEVYASSTRSLFFLRVCLEGSIRPYLLLCMSNYTLIGELICWYKFLL